MAKIILEWEQRGFENLRRSYRSITESANTFQRSIARAGVAFESVQDAARRLGQQRIVFQADVSRVNASLAGIRAQIQRAQQQRINIQANAESAQSELTKIDRDIARTRELQVNVETDSDEFVRFEAQIRRLEARRIRLRGNVEGLEPELARVDARIASLQDKEIKVTADADQANRSLVELDGILERLDGDEAAAELDRLNRELRKVGRAAEQPRRSLGGFNSILAGFSAGATAAAISGLASALRGLLGLPVQLTREFLAFDQALTQAGVISGSAGTDEFSALAEEIERLGIVTSGTPQQLSQAATALSRAGFTAEQTAQALEGVVRGAEATGTSILDTGDLVAKALRAFSLEAEQSLAVTNAFVATANSTNTTLGTLGESFSFVAAQAARSNQPIDDTLVLLGLLGDAGLQGSQAGTNLAASLERLQIASAANASSFPELVKGSARAARAFNEIGAEVRNADGTMQSLLDVLPTIQENLNELSQEDQDILLKSLFGVEGGRAFATLLNAAPERIAAVTNEVRVLAQEGEGAATRASEALLDSLSGSFQLLGGSVATLNNQIAAAFAPALEAGVRAITAILNEVISTEGIFIALNGSAREFAEFLEQNPAVVQDLATVFTDVLQIISELTGGVLAELTEILSQNPALVRDMAGSFVTLVGAVSGVANVLVSIVGTLVGVQRAVVGIIDSVSSIPLIGDALGGILLILRNAIDPLGTIAGGIERIQEGLARIGAIRVTPTVDPIELPQDSIDEFTEAIARVAGVEVPFEQISLGAERTKSEVDAATAAAESHRQKLEEEKAATEALVSAEIDRTNQLAEIESANLSAEEAARRRAAVEVAAAQAAFDAQKELFDLLESENEDGDTEGLIEAEKELADARLTLQKSLAAERVAIEEAAKAEIERTLEDQAALVESNAQDRARALIALEQNLLANGTSETVVRATVELAGIEDARAQIQEQISLENQRRDAFEDGTDDRATAIATIDRLQTELAQNALDATRARRQQEMVAEDERLAAIEREGEAAVTSLNSQAQAQQILFDQQTRSAQTSASVLDAAITAIESQNAALETRGQLLSAQTSLQGAIDNSEVQGLERALEIRRKLTESANAENEEDQLSRQERTKLEQELAAITGSRRTSERQIQQELLEAEATRRENALASLNAQQALELQSLVLDQQKEQLARQRAVIESEIAAIQARAAAASLQADQDRLAIQARSLQSQLATSTDPEEQQQLQSAIEQNRLGQEEAGNAITGAQQQVELQDQAVALRQRELEQLAGIQAAQRESLVLQQSLAQFELAQAQAAEAKATATDLAAEGNRRLLTEATRNADELERAADAAERTAQALLSASQSRLSLPGGDIPGFRDGTGPGGAPGGLAIVGEAGPELVSLPRGARVFSNPASRQLAAQSMAVNPAIAQRMNIPAVMPVSPMLPTISPLIKIGGQGMSTAAMESQLTRQTELLQSMENARLQNELSDKIRRGGRR